LTRAIQQKLKDQGFYYGEVDGQAGDETSAAIRRYQIRHGLKVTGQLSDETLRSLGVSRNGPGGTEPTPGYQVNKGPSNGLPAPGYRENENPSETQPGGQDNRQWPGQYDSGPVPHPNGPENYDEMRQAPYVAPQVVTSLSQFFAGTIYERAPAQVQENVLYAVQGELMRRGFFRGLINGRLGRATSDAITRLQEEEGLPMSGRLDNETIDDLRAFPGQRNGPPEQGYWERPGRGRFYRNFPYPF
ncbi:MAG: peptidoglycan-binding protein, partial [Verrucomicrobia bacterium]|nr:peptidoglycan-binding protein [Verrucomicrobiota bacterium]